MNLPITVQQSLKITFIEWVFQAECMMIAMPDTTPAHSQTVIRLCAGKRVKSAPRFMSPFHIACSRTIMQTDLKEGASECESRKSDSEWMG